MAAKPRKNALVLRSTVYLRNRLKIEESAAARGKVALRDFACKRCEAA
jgi:hypothetical protein